MNINSTKGADGSVEFSVILTPNDCLRLPAAIEVLDKANTCAEVLLALSIIALEMGARHTEFKEALREATAQHGSAADQVTSDLNTAFGVSRRVLADRRSNIVRRQDEDFVLDMPDRRASFGQEAIGRRSGVSRRSTEVEP